MLFRRSPVVIPTDLRTRLEAARLDLLAVLRPLFELDADYAEALWALDQPPGRFKLRAMLRDTSAALERMPQLLAKFHKMLPPRAHAQLPALERLVRKSLNPREAYNMVPSRDPQNG